METMCDTVIRCLYWTFHVVEDVLGFMPVVDPRQGFVERRIPRVFNGPRFPLASRPAGERYSRPKYFHSLIKFEWNKFSPPSLRFHRLPPAPPPSFFIFAFSLVVVVLVVVVRRGFSLFLPLLLITQKVRTRCLRLSLWGGPTWASLHS